DQLQITLGSHTGASLNKREQIGALTVFGWLQDSREMGGLRDACEFLIKISEDSPLVLRLDALEAASPPMLTLLQRLARQLDLRPSKLLLLCTLTEEEPERITGLRTSLQALADTETTVEFLEIPPLMKEALHTLSAQSLAVETSGIFDSAKPSESLVELLAHPQSPVRAVAQRTLANETDPSVLPLLVSALRSKTADTRLRAVELVLNIDDPAVLELLLERLDDSRAKVARRAVQGIAESHDPRVEVELLTRAFRERWILRSSAYAILAIVAREQQTLEPMLGAGHVDSLLRGLASKDPFIAGTCATALAGIGFRSSDPDVSLWLNSHVPDRLVGTVSGDIYFNDFSALQGPALQRLEQIAILFDEQGFAQIGDDHIGPRRGSHRPRPVGVPQHPTDRRRQRHRVVG
ncbi:MAG: HEAT repeat domain-containing protein, partial [Candidatus Poseidoniia archaeon]